MDETIRDKVGDAAMYLQLAEESVELAFACIKKTRILMGVNPTLCTAESVDQSITEEITDVVLCASELDLSVDNELMSDKRKRWRERLCSNSSR
jgi:NTP pyrophosphatase (non-canonical NTP hydrolase)